MSGRIDRRSASTTTPADRPRKPAGAPPVADPAPARWGGDGPKPTDGFAAGRGRSEAIVFTARSGGPGAIGISAAGQLQLDGRAGPEATIELARMIEGGAAPFARTSPAQQKKLLESLTAALAPQEKGKPTTGATLARSAAATLLLSLAQAGSPDLKKQAMTTYVGAMAREKVSGLKTSMLVNLDASHLSLEGAQQVEAAKVRGTLLPETPPYDEWFKGRKSTVNVKHYVMEDFWKVEVSAYKRRGFTVTEDKPGRLELTKDLTDPSGTGRPLKAHVTLVKSNDDVLRDMDDPDTQMIVYSGHSQLGGIADAALARGPKQMNGTKLVQMYLCRGKQTAGDFHAKYPGAHLTTTASSAYGEDDTDVLNLTYEMIARRGTYGELYKGLVSGDMIQPKSNNVLPNDPRSIAHRDGDRDGLNDVTPLGADRLFDPARGAIRGGTTDFRPRVSDTDPQKLSGEKLDHALGYANTAFFYFAEANRAAPITKGESDKFLSTGWFKSGSDEPLQVTAKKKDGQTYYEVAVNSRYSGQSREAIASMMLYELQKHLCLDDKGKFTEADKLRGLMLVGGYVDMMVEYGDDCDKVIKEFGKRYGFEGVSYDTLFKAALKDGHDGSGTLAALDYLKRNGVTVHS
ncbi:MAG: hypothetical protein ACYC8T_07845 [Myxococcaceae bacterium]